MQTGTLLRKSLERGYAWLGFTWHHDFLQDRFSDQKRQVAADRAFEWLVRASHAVGGRGVSVGYQAGTGWLESYPEVSGYTLCTFRLLAESHLAGSHVKTRAKEMVISITAWLKSLYQPGRGYAGWLEQGGEDGGLIFDTGQVLHGLLSIFQQQPDLCDISKIEGMTRWLRESMSPDGAWRRRTFWGGEAPPYYLRVTWALFRAARILGDPGCREDAKKSLGFFRNHMDSHSWIGFKAMAVARDYLNILHFHAYTIQGMIECGVAAEDADTLGLAEKSLEQLAVEFTEKGTLPGAVDACGRWRHQFRCPTAEFQTAICFHRMGSLSGKPEFSSIGDKILNRAIEGCVWQAAVPATWRGGVWGSLPIQGDYQPWTLISWGAKFLIDAVLISGATEDDLMPLIRLGELA